MKPELKTERLRLKPVDRSDSEELLRIITDKFVRRYLFDGEILQREQIWELIDVTDATFRDKNYGLWLIVSDETREIAGFTGLWHFFEEAQPQLLYALLPGFTGRGLAREAARRIIEYAFSDLAFGYLDASCDAPNKASQRVAENLGMKKFKEEIKNALPTVFYRLENE